MRERTCNVVCLREKCPVFADEHKAFFSQGRLYRSNQYTATSFEKATAERFLGYQGATSPKVLWTIEFDPIDGCKHVNLMSDTPYPDEVEFLFAPFSAFEVLKEPRDPGEVDGEGPYWSPDATDINTPHRIRIRARPDNRESALACPIAPWG